MKQKGDLNVLPHEWPKHWFWSQRDCGLDRLFLLGRKSRVISPDSQGPRLSPAGDPAHRGPRKGSPVTELTKPPLKMPLQSQGQRQTTLRGKKDGRNDMAPSPLFEENEIDYTHGEDQEKYAPNIGLFYFHFFSPLSFSKFFYIECNTLEIRRKIRYISTEMPLLPSEAYSPKGRLLQGRVG